MQLHLSARDGVRLLLQPAERQPAGRQLRRRLQQGPVRTSCTAGGDRIRFAASAELDGAGLVPADADATGRPGSYGRADRDVERMGSMAFERLSELDAAASAQADSRLGQPLPIVAKPASVI